MEDLVESRMQLFGVISCFHCGRLEWRELEEERVTIAFSSRTNTQKFGHTKNLVERVNVRSPQL